MVAVLDLEILLKRKQELEHQYGELIKELKEDYRDCYDWIVQNGNQIGSLKDFSKNIALALLIFSSAETTVTLANAADILSATNNRPQETRVITIDELQSLTEEDRARLVWHRYGHIIELASAKYNVDKKLIFSTIMIESGGNSSAYRYEPHINDASYGLGQILYGTARGIGFEGPPEKLYDPEVTIDLIAKYHARNQEVYKENLTPEQLT
ncbi:transglycosylase SLT domain-containing protein, partial [candidate division WWE3 bacterium]|nr:transglycosylase SLT domain-containing protein [candidate division WWE3 bacterium]